MQKVFIHLITSPEGIFFSRFRGNQPSAYLLTLEEISLITIQNDIERQCAQMDEDMVALSIGREYLLNPEIEGISTCTSSSSDKTQRSLHDG